jgi:WXG100 family type VII secretion target
MPYIEIPVRRSRTFVPPEAHGIAARWRALAKEIREISNSLQSVSASLNSTWEGNSKQRFMAEFESSPGNVAGCADLLESLASQVESMTVTEWEIVMERVWRPEDVGA